MTTLYTYEKYYESRGNTLLPLQCEQCNKIFHIIKRRIQQALRCKTKTKCNYCSKSCASKAKAKLIELECNNCKKHFLRMKSKIKKSRSENYFCSKSCSNKFNYLKQHSRTYFLI